MQNRWRYAQDAKTGLFKEKQSQEHAARLTAIGNTGRKPTTGTQIATMT